jgi:hypothetical protein
MAHDKRILIGVLIANTIEVHTNRLVNDLSRGGTAVIALIESFHNGYLFIFIRFTSGDGAE